jgi:hypothetical protein
MGSYLAVNLGLLAATVLPVTLPLYLWRKSKRAALAAATGSP